LRYLLAVLGGLAGALAATTVSAQTLQQDYDWCYSPTATDAQTISGCTAMIESGQGTAAKQADYHDARAYGYNSQGLYDLAIADESRAIALEPDDANAYNTRCLAYANEKRYDQAISDCTEALTLKPGFALAYEGRGNAWRAKGDVAQAIADYRAAARLDPSRHQPLDALRELGAAP